MSERPPSSGVVTPAQNLLRATPAPRLESVDLLRGLVMLLMALDHTRDFFTNIPYPPLDLQQTFPALFLTRWITHLCAPAFLFLAGVGAFLSTTRGKTTGELSWFLVTRGAWLVLLELTYVNWFGWSFHIHFQSYGLQVIWAIGCSMIVLGGLVWLPRWAVMAFGVALISLHHTLDGVKPDGVGTWAILWRILHVPGEFWPAPELRIGIGYPLIPWTGVMAVGFAFGPVLVREPGLRRKMLLVSGAALTVLFVAIRAVNVYGDPIPWEPQKNALFTIFSFVNCNKYPPSLSFVLMTLGPALLLLALFDRGTPALLKPLLVFGRVPLFFYLLHLPVIQAVALLVKSIQGASAPQSGVGLAAVYLFWMAIMLLLYPVCRWFARFKQRNSHRTWLSYL